MVIPKDVSFLWIFTLTSCSSWITSSTRLSNCDSVPVCQPPIRHISPAARFSRSFTGRCSPDYRRFVVAFPADSANFVAVRLGSRRPCKVSNLKTIEMRVRIDYSFFLSRRPKSEISISFSAKTRRPKLMRICLMNARRPHKGSRRFRSVNLAEI